MADRRVRLILEAQIDGFKRAMAEASRSTDQVKKSAEELGRTPLRQQAQEIGAEWSKTSRSMRSDMQTVGTGFSAAGASILGVYGALVTTGIEYNTLQQVSGRAMETIMGSASAAADQMERLHAFADESPFSRATWIQAQQQLLAFGMEADNVVGTLDAVQNAVAAIGGGDAEIMRIVDILGTVQGQGRITATELNRLGAMGINAAELIGDAMGVSGNEIREQISSGALDADTAIAALTDGMMMRFDGAAEGMRETMTGAWDRLKAAWRDLGSVLAQPLVGSDGGGLLVDLVNSAADLLRMVQRLPDPIIQTVGALGGLAGVAALGYGGLMLLVPQLVAFHDAKRRLATVMPGTNRLIGSLGRIAGTATAGVMALQVASHLLGRTTEDLGDRAAIADAIRNLGSESGSASARIDELTTSLGRTGAGVEGLHNAFEVLDTGFGEHFMAQPLSAIGAVEGDMVAAEAAVSNFDGAMADLVRGGELEAAADGLRFYVDEANDAGYATSRATGHLDELEEALYASGISMDEFLVAIGASEVVFNEATGMYENADITLESLAGRMGETGDAAEDAAQGSDELNEALAEVGVTADGVIDSMSEFLDLLYQTGLLTMSARDAQAAYESQLDSVDQAVQDLTDSITEEYIEKGYSEEAARALAAEQVELGHALNDNKTDFDLTTEAGRNAQTQFHDTMRSGMDLTEALAENGATQDEVQDALRRTYDDTIAAGVAFGMTEDDARALTHEILDIPEGVDIDSWMSDEAKRVAEELNAELDRADGRRTSSSHVHTINTRRTGSTGSDRVGGATANTMYATGGAVHGPGTGTSDSIAAWLSNGEHVLTARDVRALGGQSGVYAMRQSLHSPRQQVPSGRHMIPAYAGGGAVGASQIADAVRGGLSGGAGVNIENISVAGGDTQQVLNRVGDAIFRRLNSEGVRVGAW